MTETPRMLRARAMLFFARDGWRSTVALLRGKGGRRRDALAHVTANARRGDAGSVLAALDDFGRHRRFLINVGDEKGPLLAQYVRDAGPGARVLELGAYVGYSAVLIGSTLDDGGRLVSVEKDPLSAEVAREVIAFAGLEHKVELQVGDSGELIPRLAGPFDLVFLDHWKDAYKRDLQLLERHGLLREGTVVFADNVGPLFNPEEYLDFVRNCGRFESRNLGGHLEYSTLEDAVEISTYLGPGDD